MKFKITEEIQEQDKLEIIQGLFEFYEKNGYKEVFTLEKYPLTGKRHYYTKEL